ncbi:MAG: hypothetical protein ABWY16_19350 [Pedobacter sp.]|uniref:hypothetical protein n=1 Tax=Pedobacter sp. TaxID=1411316 RepID=UPI003398462A
MQHIQDNEFDQSFRDRFDEAEIEAPAHLWDKIETQLIVKPRRIFPVYWLAAAIGIVALSVGFFISNADHSERSHRMAVVKTKPAVAVAVPAVQSTISSHSHGSAVKNLQHSKRFSALTAVAVEKKVQSPDVLSESAKESTDSKKDLADLQPLALNAHLYAREVTIKQQKLSLPLSGDIVLANNAEGPATGDGVMNENENRTANRGIRNMGDLINYVVDKVDKSDEKIIQFKTEDDNSSLVALNIGIIRFNTKKHK